MQYHDWRANVALGALDFPRARAAYTDGDATLARSAAAHLEFCTRYGLVDTADWNMKLAWLFRRLEPSASSAICAASIALDPEQAAAHFNLGKELARQGRDTEAADAFREAVRLTPALASVVPARALSPETIPRTRAHGG